MKNSFSKILNRVGTYRDGLSVERLHTHYHNIPYNNGFHSANAALIADELAQLCHLPNSHVLKIMRYMLLHDVAERFVGDIPSPFKRVLGDKVKGLMDKAEEDWLEGQDIFLPNLCPLGKEICKVSDIIELMEYSKREITTGNSGVAIVIVNCKRYLAQMIILNKHLRDFVHYYLEQNNGN